MMHRRHFPALRLTVLTLFYSVSAVSIATQQSKPQASATEIAFTVSMPKPHTGERSLNEIMNLGALATLLAP
jgi:hypothetical protein